MTQGNLLYMLSCMICFCIHSKVGENVVQTCNFGTRVAPPINSTAYISSVCKPECLSSSFTGIRDLSQRSPQSSSNFSRVMVLLKGRKKNEQNQFQTSTCYPQRYHKFQIISNLFSPWLHDEINLRHNS